MAWTRHARTALTALMLAAVMPASSAATDEPVTITPVGSVCASTQECRTRHALFFIHGIFGSDKTFVSSSYDWPSKEKEAGILGQSIDVYVIRYQTPMINWLRKDIATLDEIVDDLYFKIYGDHSEGVDGLLDRRPYKSYGFIGHSLGGNVASAFIHSVKSTRGHIERARIAYGVTLGTPVFGADIANLGLLAKHLLFLQQDPLLDSLQRDNTFLRMMQRWRVAEHAKAQVMECRPVPLFAGYETTRTDGFKVVASQATANELGDFPRETKFFDGFNHVELAAPTPSRLDVVTWVNQKIAESLRDADAWKGPLCHNLCYATIGRDGQQSCRTNPNAWPGQ